MIHEWRSYRLKPGAAADYLGLLADEGLPLVTRCLPLMGYWLGETGPLNTIHHLWAYQDWAEREALRAELATDEGWTRGFIPKAFALVEEQGNRFLRLERSSPDFDASSCDAAQAAPGTTARRATVCRVLRRPGHWRSACKRRCSLACGLGRPASTCPPAPRRRPGPLRACRRRRTRRAAPPRFLAALIRRALCASEWTRGALG